MTEVSKNKFGRIEWKVDIDAFEGPLDLLLYLIRKHNLDIYDIHIADITAEYLKYVEVIRQLDLDNVGDFLVMASILMAIKAKTLLPSDEPIEEGEEDAEKMRRELIERLIEYKRYKESSSILQERERLYEGVVGLHQYPLKEFGQDIEATLFDLIDAFQNLIENAREEVKDIITEEYSVEDKIRFIMGVVENKSKIILGDLLEKGSSVMELIVTLLAILELVRTHQITVSQKQKFGTIYIEDCDGSV
ncbi:MAG: segregation/condensation protein A [Elusimicrobiota bacterium]